MNYSDFVKSRKKSGQDLLDNWNSDKASAVHMLVGLADEWMELMSADSVENAKEEAGDFIFYVEGLLQDYGMTLPEKIAADFHGGAFTELYTMVKRHLMYNKVTSMRELREAAVRSIQHALSHLIIEWEIPANFQELQQENQDKLTKRYAAGYSDKAAQERADKSA